MPNIRPVSDLRNYTDVLKDISIDSPVFFNKERQRKIRNY